MKLGSLVLVVLGVLVVAMRNMRMVGRFLVVAGFVVVMRLFVVLCRFGVMVRGFLVMIVL